MALIAHLPDNRLMNIVVKNSSLAGTVRIMTGCTTTILDRIIKMPFLEACLIGLMTFKAERLNLGPQELFIVLRSVRGMATKAALGHGSMPELVFANFFGQVLMATQTELVA